jgi:CubicO group peptidase (beta-lactamase class C family)
VPLTTSNLITQFFAEKVAPGLNLSIYQRQAWTHFTKGMADFGQTPIAHDQYFDLASLTKTFTATLVLGTSQQNSGFRLSDPMGKYLPNWSARFPNLTVQDLLTHHSDLWRNFDKPDPQTVKAQEFLQTFLNPANYSSRHPGQTNYFDYNYLLLGEILEIVHQQPLNQILSEFLARHELFEISYQPEGKFVATKLEVRPGMPHDEKARILQKPTGHAGLFGTHRALLRWMELWLANGFNLAEDLYNQAFGPKQTISSLEVEDEVYGLVWRQGRYSQEYWNHAGFTGPALFLNPQDQTAMVLTCSHLNVADTNEQRQKYRSWLRRLGSLEI